MCGSAWAHNKSKETLHVWVPLDILEDSDTTVAILTGIAHAGLPSGIAHDIDFIRIHINPGMWSDCLKTFRKWQEYRHGRSI